MGQIIPLRKIATGEAELVRGDQQSKKSDIFSLGMVMWWIAHLIRWCWHQNPYERLTSAELVEELSEPIDVISEKLKLR